MADIFDNLKASLNGKGKLPHYSPNHKVGMRVPKGGSNCAKCEYVNGQKCRNMKWVHWHGSNVIPAPTNEYCCDFFEINKDIGVMVK